MTKKNTMPKVSNKVRKFYADPAAVRNHFAKVAKKQSRLTLEVDRLLVSNEWTLAEIMTKINSLKATTFKGSEDFKSPDVLKKHLRFRAGHNGFVYKFDQYGHVLFLDVAAEPQTVTFPEVKAETK